VAAPLSLAEEGQKKNKNQQTKNSFGFWPEILLRNILPTAMSKWGEEKALGLGAGQQIRIELAPGRPHVCNTDKPGWRSALGQSNGGRFLMFLQFTSCLAEGKKSKLGV